MTTTESKLATIAEQFASAFEVAKRGDTDETYFRLKDGSPEWMTDAVREAHDSADILPNDWIYEKCSHIADAMDNDDPDRWENLISEWADGMVDVYNADRAAWLASHLAFGGIVDEAVEEFGHSDQGIYGDIGIGQYRMIEQIAYACVRAVKDQADEE